MNKYGIALLLAIFLGIFSFLGIGDVKLYLENPDFSKESAVIDATIVSSKKSTASRKGISVDSYFMKYTFSVNGKEYNSGFSRTELTADKYRDAKLVSVAYKTADPGINTPTDDVVERSVGGLTWEIIKSFLIAVLIAIFAGSIVASKLGWMKEEAPSPEAQPQ